MITNTYKPYPEFQKHKRIDKIRNRFVGGMSHMFFGRLNEAAKPRGYVAVPAPAAASATAFVDDDGFGGLR